MGMFFEIVGMVTVGAFTLAVVAGALALFWFRDGVRGFLEKASLDGIEIPPRRIQLRPEENPRWYEPDAIAEGEAVLRGLGFLPAGCFVVAELAELRLSGFVHPETGLACVLYDHPEAGVFCDGVGLLEGGGSITVSNAPHGAGLAPVPGHPKILDRALSVREIVARTEAESREQAVRRFERSALAREIEEAYAREIDWRNSRGGPSEAEILSESEGIDVTPDQVAWLQSGMSRLAAEQLGESCLDQFMSETLLSVSEWEKIRGQVVVIHDGLDAEQVLDRFRDFAELPSEPAADLATLEPADTPARALFRRLNGRLPTHAQYTLLGQVGEPTAADVYAGTSEPE